MLNIRFIRKHLKRWDYSLQFTVYSLLSSGELYSLSIFLIFYTHCKIVLYCLGYCFHSHTHIHLHPHVHTYYKRFIVSCIFDTFRALPYFTFLLIVIFTILIYPTVVLIECSWCCPKSFSFLYYLSLGLYTCPRVVLMYSASSKTQLIISRSLNSIRIAYA